ncbi:MFS transporter [Nosocomiicoccus sp. HMSC059G07]|uniref:MFS transporter n=1 Tax=Nosocomiicoccus sp. HMSC059G07 TaxID=1739531 RepID=UPI0008A54EE6|nr:MFS transporter [Nosocomiicoccus sp. HMSC059G07]OFO55897.1 MFS transporter [Nosocomiicoccus sp. HMSC059G07]
MDNSNLHDRIWTKDFIIILFANFFIFLSFQMTLPTLPLFVQDLGLDNKYIGLVVGIFTFSALLIRPAAGTRLDTKGRRYVFFYGLIIFLVSTYSLTISTVLFVLLIVRVVQGIGWGSLTTATGTIATDLIPASRRGEGLGFFSISANIALALGPALGLFLVDYISFTWLFILCGTLILIAFILATQINYVKPDKEASKSTTYHRFDLFEKTALPASFLLMFVTFTFGGIAAFLPAYTIELGFSSHSIQIYFVVYALALLSTRFYAGQLFDRHGMGVVFVPGMIMITVAMFMMFSMTSATTLYIAAILYGLGFGFVQPALQAMAVNRAASNRRGMANATFFSFFDLGVGLGALIFGFVSDLFGYSYIYLISAISIIIAFSFYLAFVFKHRKEKA